MDWHGQTSTPGDRRWQTLLLVLSLLLLMCCPAAAQEADVSTSPDAYPDAERKYHRLLLGATLGITAWGAINWDYGDRTPNSTSEGWFEYHTDSGGADKAGHFYTSYVMANALPSLYRDWGFSHDQASRRGLYSSLVINGVMEVGDSFSEYGFSWEDMVANNVGALAGYWLDRHPWWGERLTFRVEYLPRFDRFDILTDYENMKYMAALRLDSLFGQRQRIWRYADVQLGYYTRGYEEPQDMPRRYGYVGLGINLSAVAERFGWRRSASFLRYWQPPEASLQERWSADR